MDRLVAGLLHPGREVVGEGAAGGEAGVAAVGLDVALDAVVVGVAAGQQADPRGAAERVGDVVAVEGHPPFGDQVERVRHRPDRRRAGERFEGRVEAVERLVVGLDDDEVRLGRAAERPRARRAAVAGRATRQSAASKASRPAASGRRARLGARACLRRCMRVDTGPLGAKTRDATKLRNARRRFETLDNAQDAPSFFAASRKFLTVALGALRPSSFSPWRLTQITGTFIFSSGATSVV